MILSVCGSINNLRDVCQCAGIRGTVSTGATVDVDAPLRKLRFSTWYPTYACGHTCMRPPEARLWRFSTLDARDSGRHYLRFLIFKYFMIVPLHQNLYADSHLVFKRYAIGLKSYSDMVSYLTFTLLDLILYWQIHSDYSFYIGHHVRINSYIQTMPGLVRQHNTRFY